MLDIPITESGGTYTVEGMEKPDKAVKVLVVDAETTGVDKTQDEAIEVAGVMVEICAEQQRVYSITPVFSFLRQPTRNEISSKITEITGITPEMVRGKALDLHVIYEHYFAADLILAHNGSFDKPFFEDLLPEIKENPKPWACSCWDPNWTAMGFTKRKLGVLLEGCGYALKAHRAVNDCIGVAWLLLQRPEAIPIILQRGLNPSYELEIRAAPYNARHKMEELGFRREGKKWTKSYDSVPDMFEDRQAIAALASGLPGNYFLPSVRPIDPLSRFSLDV